MDINHTDLKVLGEIIAREVGDILSTRSLPGRWLTLREAMEYARVKSVSTIRNWIDEGYIYAFKRSGEWIVDRESIDDWYNSERI